MIVKNRVKIKTWEELESEFGFDEDGYIRVSKNTYFSKSLECYL